MTGRGPLASLDVYLQPSVVGGGLGDVEEVLVVGRRLERLGARPIVYRRPGHRLPESVDGPWGWPSVRRVHRLAPRSLRALTVTPWWGVSAAPAGKRSGPPGPWSVETADLEARYGRERIVHLSIEEFARTLTSREQARERYREGGVAVREIPLRLTGPADARERQIVHEAYRTWRAFDRSNVLHLFAGFRPSRAFAREFPEAVQTGPLWPEARARNITRRTRRRWVWYASPSSSARLATAIARVLRAQPAGSSPVEVEVRGPRRFPLPPGPGVRWRWVEPSPAQEWSRRFRSADLRITTGSRTLLEALVAGGPFLYFNGALNRGPRTRRHRPEKIEGFLRAWRRHRVSASLRRDLSDFSRLRRVSPVLGSALNDSRWSTQFPPSSAAVDYPRGWDDAGRLVDGWATEWARSTEAASVVVRRWRAAARSFRLRL